MCPKEESSIEAYVDGSYKDGKTSWAAVIVKNGELQTEFSGLLDEQTVAGTRQVAGEVKAVEEVLTWCKNQKISSIKIFYDYMGIECWAKGTWKANLPLTQAYRDFVRSSGIRVEWVKVKSHSGIKYNEQVDKLARRLVEGL
jgi:ribonuclease H-related protein